MWLKKEAGSRMIDNQSPFPLFSLFGRESTDVKALVLRAHRVASVFPFHRAWRGSMLFSRIRILEILHLIQNTCRYRSAFKAHFEPEIWPRPTNSRTLMGSDVNNCLSGNMDLLIWRCTCKLSNLWGWRKFIWLPGFAFTGGMKFQLEDKCRRPK